MITLRPHQITAKARLIEILEQYQVAYLRGEVRTGKTLTALATAKEMQVGSVLVLTKKKAIPSIEKDAAALGVEATVTNYEAVHKLPADFWDFIVLDEAHNFGTYPKPSKRIKEVAALSARWWLLMSGTPTPESYSQLYHQFAVTGRGPWRHDSNFYVWARQHVNVKEKRVGQGQIVKDYSDGLPVILSDVEPYTVNITQEDAGITTTIDERVHAITMHTRTRRLMQRLAKDKMLPGRRQCIPAGGAALMQALRQIASGTLITRMTAPPGWAASTSTPIRKKEGTVPDLRPLKGRPEAVNAAMTRFPGRTACIDIERRTVELWPPMDTISTFTIFDRTKARYVRDKILPTGKTAILYAFDAEGVMLRQEFAAHAVDTPEAFNAAPDAIYIGQVQSSREGVNLSTAKNLVFFGIDYSALSYLQGRDRATFMGREDPPILHWLLAEGSLEPKVMEAVRSKEDYTITHYRRDRKTLTHADHTKADAGDADPAQDHLEAGSPRLAGDPDHAEQQSGLAGPDGAQGWAGDLFGGQAAGPAPDPGATGAAPGTGGAGLPGDGGHQSRGSDSGPLFLSVPPDWPDRFDPLPRHVACHYCYGRGYSRRWWQDAGAHVAIGGRLAMDHAKHPDPLPCPYCGRPGHTGATDSPWSAWEQAAR